MPMGDLSSGNGLVRTDTFNVMAVPWSLFQPNYRRDLLRVVVFTGRLFFCALELKPCLRETFLAVRAHDILARFILIRAHGHPECVAVVLAAVLLELCTQSRKLLFLVPRHERACEIVESGTLDKAPVQNATTEIEYLGSVEYRLIYL